MGRLVMTSQVRGLFRIAALAGALFFSVLTGNACSAKDSGVSGYPGSAGRQRPLRAREAGLEEKLARVQKAICERGLKWRAKMTEVASLEAETEALPLESELCLSEGPARSMRIEVLEELPESFDWRDYRGGDWTTPARNQGRCGACWAFCAVGVVEAQFNIFANNPDLDLDLSEQELISFQGSSGCGGGSEMAALSYIRDTGIVDEGCLPYRADDAQYPFCDDANDRRQWIEEALRIERSDPMTPEEIKSALIANGPVGILIGAKVRNDFKFYAGGIYEPTETEPSLGAHSVLLVGYNDAEGCWVIKNSWSAAWGEEGFARLRYGVCDVEENAYLRGATVSSLNLKDSDGDGFFDVATGGNDYDDSDANVHPGGEYRVFYKDSLTLPEWGMVDARIVAVAAVTGVLDTSADRMRFYRVMEISPLMRDEDGDGIPDSWRPVVGLKPIRYEGDIGLIWESVPPAEALPVAGIARADHIASALP
jgi:C1A family cysteine protease